MRKVRRWSVPPTGMFTLAMPAGARLLTAQSQGDDNVVLWALIDEQAPKIPRHVLLTITGHAIDTSLELEHVATIQTTTEPVVEFHVLLLELTRAVLKKLRQEIRRIGFYITDFAGQSGATSKPGGFSPAQFDYLVDIGAVEID